MIVYLDDRGPQLQITFSCQRPALDQCNEGILKTNIINYLSNKKYHIPRMKRSFDAFVEGGGWGLEYKVYLQLRTHFGPNTLPHLVWQGFKCMRYTFLAYQLFGKYFENYPILQNHHKPYFLQGHLKLKNSKYYQNKSEI